LTSTPREGIEDGHKRETEGDDAREILTKVREKMK